MRPPLPGVILAGGLSRRMGGGDKSLLDLNGLNLIDHVVKRLRPQVTDIAINANGPSDRFSYLGYSVIPDSIEGFAGPLAGVLTGLDWAAEAHPDASHIVTAAADTPFFPQDLVERLSAAAGDRSDAILLASTGGKTHSVFGLWPVALRHDLRDWLTSQDNRKVLAWTDRHGFDLVSFDDPASDLDPFFNINRPDDLDAALNHLRSI
ncbi:molybdenum cofactor guanylyltransferase MobA [Coralliovum pocilloporae]|uniref:molybdenum cofactor guanylyltransferase MobA n=1 Tax=Coralliovum pocilloporae TaxID=3066369 RepID=UPI0033070BCD